MRIVFMGTPGFSVPVLQALHAAGHDIAAVYTQPPRPAGRGKRARQSAVHDRALSLNLPVRHPATLKTPEAQAAFAALNADIAVVVAYGLILPQAVLDMPRHGCLNIHASILPRWRGAAPIHRAIMAGDTRTGVCIMQMEAGLDTGPVLLQSATDIAADDTTGRLHDRLSAMGADLIVQALARLGELTAVPQPDAGVTYAAKIDKAEARIDWTQPAAVVDRLIRGLSPAPAAWCDMAGERVRLLDSSPAPGQGEPGQVLSAQTDLIVACGDGAVAITRLQRPGGLPQPAATALRGFDPGPFVL